MKHNYGQMLIFKQRSIKCTSFGCSASPILMKSLAGNEGEIRHSFGFSWMENLHMSWLTWLPSRILAVFLELNQTLWACFTSLVPLAWKKWVFVAKLKSWRAHIRIKFVLFFLSVDLYLVKVIWILEYILVCCTHCFPNTDFFSIKWLTCKCNLCATAVLVWPFMCSN